MNELNKIYQVVSIIDKYGITLNGKIIESLEFNYLKNAVLVKQILDDDKKEG